MTISWRFSISTRDQPLRYLVNLRKQTSIKKGNRISNKQRRRYFHSRKKCWLLSGKWCFNSPKPIQRFAFFEWDTVFLTNTDLLYKDIQNELARLEDAKLDISDYQNWTKTYASSSTATDAYAITLSPAISAYLAGQTFRFQADIINTWAATLNVNGLWTKTIKKQHDRDLESWDIEAWQIVVVCYDWTYFQMDSQLATIPTIDINWQTEDTTGDMDADYFLEFDVGAWANRKIHISKFRATTQEAKDWIVTNKFITPEQAKLYFPKPIAGTDILLCVDNTVVSTSSGTYVKKYEFAIPRSGEFHLSTRLTGKRLIYCIFKDL